MALKENLKSIIIQNGWTISDVVSEINNRHGFKHSIQNFSAKMSRGTLRYIEVEEVLDIIGYDIVWNKRD